MNERYGMAVTYYIVTYSLTSSLSDRLIVLTMNSKLGGSSPRIHDRADGSCRVRAPDGMDDQAWPNLGRRRKGTHRQQQRGPANRRVGQW